MHIKKLVIQGFKSFARKTEIPMTERINVVLGPNGSGKSSSYDTLVTLSTGEEVQLGDLVEKQLEEDRNIKTLKDGVYVNGDESLKIFSLNKETMKVEKKPISKFIRRKGDPLYEIVTATGKKVKATGCHPVMVFKNGEVQSTLIRDLKEKDLMASPRNLKFQGKKFDEDISRLLGYIVGDGYIAKDRIEFVNNDAEVINDFKKIINNKFDVEIKERLDKNATRLYIRDKAFLKKIRSYFKDINGSITSIDKELPAKIMKSDNKSLSNFVAGLYDTEGSVRKDIAVIEFCTKNEILSRQVQGALLRFGIISRLKKRSCYAINTSKKTKRDYFYVYIYGNDNIKRFNQNISLKIRSKKKAIINHLSRNITSNPNVDLLPREVNIYIRELASLLGINIKNLRRDYPFLSAYSENRCCPTRDNLIKIINLFENKFNKLISLHKGIEMNQLYLVQCMDNLNLSGQYTCRQIGLNKTIIRRDWQKQKFNAMPENLEKFFHFIQKVFDKRIPRIRAIFQLLTNLSESNIFWDKIISIKKEETPKYVYDLTIEENHNFIANNLFIHNSNVTDSLCFVLGRLSVKSMRAAKAKNLIFQGTKSTSPAKEASVEVIFDNEDGTFAKKEKEISIKRIVRKNGQGIYKINGETKTRQDVLSLLAQAGVDPHGFNIILQGEIQNFVKMHTEERRNVIEEVSGISIYESRKTKSLKELDKTEEKLKEVSAILKERQAYLNNIEKDRRQALRYQKLKGEIRTYKASIIYKKLQNSKKEKEKISSEINKKNKEIEKIKNKISDCKVNITDLQEKINSTNENIKNASGHEQEKLNQEIADIRAEIEGLKVRLENNKQKIENNKKRKNQLEKTIKENTEIVNELKSKKGKNPKEDESQIEKKKKTLSDLENKRKKYYMMKSELKSINDRIEDKKSFLNNNKNESEILLEQINNLGKELYDNKTNEEQILGIKKEKKQKQQEIENIIERERELDKLIHTNNYEIESNNKTIEKISKLDVCPLCKNKITEEHMKNIKQEINPKINKINQSLKESKKELEEKSQKKENLKEKINKLNEEIEKRESDIQKLREIKNKNERIKEINEKIDKTSQELEELKKRQNQLSNNYEENSGIEEKIETLRLEIDEINSRNDENVDSDISFKQKELERAKISLNELTREEQDVKENIEELEKKLDNKEKKLKENRKKEELLSKKFKDLIEKRDSHQKQLRDNEIEISNYQNQINTIEQANNNLKIDNARVDAEIENKESEMLEYPNTSIIKTNTESLYSKLHKAQNQFDQMGNVNLRSLEVYEDVKKEYEQVQEKAETISSEKENILRVIKEIDIKKRRTFNRTFRELNDKFSRNFSHLSSKGHVFLELENKKDPFSGGVNVIVKTGHGKYFDVKSLSGGEQTLVALSLIFAIQELSPYPFYILDEVDAALDKRNSQRLANLLKKYMEEGQYIIISHNDEIINNASTLYGVSMNQGVSKIISMEL